MEVDGTIEDGRTMVMGDLSIHLEVFAVILANSLEHEVKFLGSVSVFTSLLSPSRALSVLDSLVSCNMEVLLRLGLDVGGL